MALQLQAISGKELVVIGYGSVRNQDLTGSVSQIQTEDIETSQTYNVEEALQSLSAGVRVTQSSGQPNAGIEVRIRGGNSIIGGNEPLYVVDGFPITGGVNFLNPADIESINILKDASATAIYGSRGANGVVIIETKSGQYNQEGQIEINSYYGVQQEIDRYELMNAKQYATIANEWLRNEGQKPIFNVDDVQNVTDWQDRIFRKAPVQSHTLTFSGGNETTRYSLSGNYYGQEGIIVNSGVQRRSMRLNLNHDVNDWISLTGNLTLSRRKIENVPVNNGSFGFTIYANALGAPPTVPVYNDEGLPTRIETVYPFSSLDLRNPEIYTNPRKDIIHANSVLANASVDIDLLEGLVFTSKIGVEYNYDLFEFFEPIIYPSDEGSASESYNYRNSILSENLLEYSTDIGQDHSLNVVSGFNYQSYMSRGLSANVSGLASNVTENFDLGSAEVINPPGNGISEWTLLSSLGRVNYSFKDKYLLTASIRADGSSRFGTDNKWGYFPSGAIAWRIWDEPFMSRASFIDNLKLRVSYGITGNTGVNPYQSLSRLRSIRYVEGNRTELPGYVSQALPNTELKWETTSQLDIGFDLTILDGQLNLVFDYYKKNTEDLLASVPLPTSVGFSSVLQNIGEIQNEGVEFTVGADVINGTDFSWNINAQISQNKNTVKKLAGDSDVLSGSSGHPFNTSTNVARVGKPLGAFYGFIEQERLDENGMTQYVDTDGNGVVNSLDRVILGSPYPDFIYGFQSNLSYENFDLSILLDGVYGNEIIWETQAVQLNSFQRGHNQFVDMMGNYWTEEDPDPFAKYPKVSSITSHQFSDRFIYDGSYLRVKKIKLAYNIPGRILSGIDKIDRAQVYISGTNLFTFTSYPSLSPEVTTKGGLEKGIDKTAYPDTKNVIFGIKVEL